MTLGKSLGLLEFGFVCKLEGAYEMESTDNDELAVLRVSEQLVHGLTLLSHIRTVLHD